VQFTVYCVGPDPSDSADALQQALAQRELPVRVTPAEVNAATITRELGLMLRDDALLGALVQRPYKQTALAYCQELTHAAQALGGVNVLARRASGLVYGDNTDVQAFVGTLGEAGVRRVRTALVMGTGQAARIALAGLRELNCARYLVGYRSPRRPMELSSQLRSLRRQLAYFPLGEMTDFFAWAAESGLFEGRKPVAAPSGKPGSDDGVKRWDLLVNATPVGMHDGDAPLLDNRNFLRCFERVLDMVPREDGTPLQREAEAAGVPALGGARLAGLALDYALELWQRELRRRQLATDGQAEAPEDARGFPANGGPRVPVLKRRRR
jgi:shikimate 5-dehydrogenase